MLRNASVKASVARDRERHEACFSAYRQMIRSRSSFGALRYFRRLWSGLSLGTGPVRMCVVSVGVCLCRWWCYWGNSCSSSGPGSACLACAGPEPSRFIQNRTRTRGRAERTVAFRAVCVSVCVCLSLCVCVCVCV